MTANLNTIYAHYQNHQYLSKEEAEQILQEKLEKQEKRRKLLESKLTIQLEKNK